MCKGITNRHWWENDVFMCSEGITIKNNNLKYVKPPNEGIVGFTSGVFSTMGVLQSQHI
jgi:hypothetical protein